jgi:hypothetical protein
MKAKLLLIGMALVLIFTVSNVLPAVHVSIGAPVCAYADGGSGGN